MDVLIKEETHKLIIRKPLLRFIKPNYNKPWEMLYDDYFIARGLKPNNMRQIVKVEGLKCLYTSIGILINLLSSEDKDIRNEALQELESIGYGINAKNPIEDELNKLIGNWQSLKTTINLEEGLIEEGSPLTDKDYLSEWNRLEDLKTRDLDPYKITEARWIVMITEEINKTKRKSE